MRLFVAAELPDDMLDALAETSALLRGSVRGRYVASDSYHVTLAFLGEVTGYRASDAAAAVECACEGFRSFQVQLGEFGSFGKRSSATLWQGFSDKGQLPELAESVRESLRVAGFTFDAKTFRPHVTLMRAANLTAGKLPTPHIACGMVAEVTLFRSDLSGSRPVYDPIYTKHLP